MKKMLEHSNNMNDRQGFLVMPGKAKNKNKIKASRGERIFDKFNVIFMICFMFIMLYPFWYVLVLSLNEGRDSTLGGVYFWPRQFTLENYSLVLSNPSLKRAYLVTIARTVLGSVYSMLITFLAAYSLSKRHLPGRNAVITFFMIPMFIGGTVVSTYVVYANLKMLNTFWIYIIPGGFSFFNMVMIRTFIYGLPPSLEESAKIDGAGYWTVLYKIVIPLCKPVIAVILLFNAVGHWMDFYTNLVYVTDDNLRTAQYILYQVVVQQRMNALKLEEMMEKGMTSAEVLQRFHQGSITPQAVQMATLMVVTLPILFVYPFVQKHFIKGVMIGAIKE